MRTKKKTIPAFKSDDEEREFWATHNSTDYVDWTLAVQARLPNLKPTLKTISIRLPAPMIEDLKVLANKRDVAYQSLIKLYLSNCIKEDFAKWAFTQVQHKHPG
jgi:predicted DNA binding CopG/RHH family protein